VSFVEFVLKYNLESQNFLNIIKIFPSDISSLLGHF